MNYKTNIMNTKTILIAMLFPLFMLGQYQKMDKKRISNRQTDRANQSGCQRCPECRDTTGQKRMDRTS